MTENYMYRKIYESAQIRILFMHVRDLLISFFLLLGLISRRKVQQYFVFPIVTGTAVPRRAIFQQTE